MLFLEIDFLCMAHDVTLFREFTEMVGSFFVS
nr:MAG TPA: hypothetical protein [Caudoviricetes sp.]